jgi:hypothetical protein
MDVSLSFATGDLGVKMLHRGFPRDARAASVGLAVLLGGALAAPTGALADEGGVSFWLPGLFGSLAAAPQQPGLSMTAMEYYDSVRAGGDVALAREITIGRFKTTLQADINASLHSRIDLGLLLPTYTFEQRFLGAQATVGVMTIVGNIDTTLQGTIAGTLGPFGFSKFGSRTDNMTAAGDLYPIFQLRWNEGVNNFMAYMTGDVPVGEYDRTSLSNLGIGHYALDGGVGYTYLNPQTGHEFSAVAGLTHNYINPYTNYQNGLDFHLDWGASQFLSKQLLVGAVGYVYNQLTGDSGSGDRVGPFESRVVGVGPQIGYIFPLGASQGYVNLKGYGEFDAHDRPHGYNAWLSLTISPPAPPTSASPRMMMTK